MPDYMGLVSNADIMIVQRLEEQAMQIHDLKARIAANSVQTHEAIKDIQNCIMTDEGQVRRHLQALALRISRIEERLGITEPTVAPGD